MIMTYIAGLIAIHDDTVTHDTGYTVGAGAGRTGPPEDAVILKAFQTAVPGMTLHRVRGGRKLSRRISLIRGLSVQRCQLRD